MKSILMLGTACALPIAALAQAANPPANFPALNQNLASPMAAEAQEAVPIAAPPEAAAENADIIVSGTRIQSNGFEAPTPVSVVTAEQIARAAPVNIADYVNQLPALSGSETPRSPRGSLAGGTAGANFLNLRNLGAPRTLVLLNGRRVTPSNLTGSADLNTLPSALVKRVDVVTGGASAAWGSDAVAGVVNFVLDTKFTGLKGQVQGGSSVYGDAESVSGDLSWGSGFSDDRGHIILSGNYSRSYSANYANRKWFKGYKAISNPAFAAGNGQPARLILPWTSLNITDGGLVASGPLKGYNFNADGSLASTNFQFAPTTSGIYAAGDKGVYNTLADESRYGQSNVPVKQGSFYGRLSYDLTNDLSVFVEGNWSKAKATTPIATYFRTGNTGIAIDNFYLPEAVRTAMTTVGVTTVPLSTSNSKLGVLQTSTDRENIRLLAGVEGKLGGGGWTYSLSYQYGRTDATILGFNNPRPGRYALATDVVANPNNPAEGICRSSIGNPGNGCVPLNPFGSNPINSQQSAYLLGTARQDLTYRQDVAAASLNGDLFDLPAGPLSLATGIEYRTEKATATSDDVSQVNGYYAGNYKPFTGKYNVKEVFAELAIPVFRDSRFGRSLDLNVAGRATDYSTSGTVTTWKAGFTYRPIDGMEVRLTRSRDIRAPNLNELFLGGTVTTQNVSDPFNAGGNAQFLQTQSGNRLLSPEKANTLTAGIVLKPAFLRGFGMSIDYYDIKIGDAIALNSAQFVVNQCFGGNTAACSQITRNSANVITGVTLQPFNARSEVARGVDVEASYRSNLGAGNIELRGLVNYTNKLAIITDGSTINRAGEVGNNVGAAEGVPRFRGLASVTYSQGPVTAQLKGRFISASKIEADWGPLDINRNHVPAIAYLDAYLSYDFKIGGSESSVFLAADNILNTAPPVVANQDNANLLGSGTNVLIYDIIGTTVRGGIRFKF